MSRKSSRERVWVARNEFSSSANLEEKELRKQNNEIFMTLGFVAGTFFWQFVAYELCQRMHTNFASNIKRI